MAKFLAREYEYHTEEEDWTEIKDAYDASEAAEMYSDEIWPYSECAESLIIEVRDETGKVTVWNVYVEHQPHFYASEYKPKQK